MKKTAWLAGWVVGVLFVLSWFNNASAVSANLVIAQVQVGGVDTGTTAQELVSVYNNSDEEINVTGWCLQYSSASNGVTFSNLACFTPPDSQTTLWLPPKSYGVIASTEFIALHNGYLADSTYSGAKISGTSGHIRIINTTSEEIDRVGYDGDSLPGVGALHPEGQAASFISSLTEQQVFQRIGAPIKQDTDNNLVDFSQLPISQLPASGLYEIVDVCPNIDGAQAEVPDGYLRDNDGNCVIPEEQNSCAGVIISEILPNPAGADSGREFIELHNPGGDSISLDNCRLSYGSDSFEFGEEVLQTGEYRAFYDLTTGLTLINSSPGTVYLINADNTEVSAVEYPADLEDDVSWARFSSGFAATYQSTPNAANVLLDIKPCPAGQFRNVDTNRCNNIASAAAGLVPCDPGQQRNPATNRCRSLTSLSSILKPCAADQFRNPETNRCKKTGSASLKPCDKGQERNPQTNRCRKNAVLANGDNNSVKDILAPPPTAQGWLLAGASIIGALAYAIWEWRNEMILGIMSLKEKLRSGLA